VSAARKIKVKMPPKKRKSSSKGDSNIRPVKIPKGKRSSPKDDSLLLTPLQFEYHEGYPRPPPKNWLGCELEGIPQRVHNLYYWEGHRIFRLDAVFQTLTEWCGLTVKELHALIGTYIDAAIILMCRAEWSRMFTILEHFEWEGFVHIVSDMDLHVIPDMQFDEYRFECPRPEAVIRHGWHRQALFYGNMARDPPMTGVVKPVPPSSYSQRPAIDSERQRKTQEEPILPLSARALRFWIPDPFEMPVPTDEEKIALTRLIWDIWGEDDQEIKDSMRSFIEREGHWPTALFVKALSMERLDILNYLMDLNDSILKQPIVSRDTQLWGACIETNLELFTTNCTLIATVKDRLSTQVLTRMERDL